MTGDSDEATTVRQQNSAARALFLPICTSRFVLFVLTLVPDAAAAYDYPRPKRLQVILAPSPCYFSLTLGPPAGQ
jgi:hypothetical protein